MAELDDRLLKDINKTLEVMQQRLAGLEQTLAGVKGAMSDAFDTSVLREWSDAMRGMKAARIVDAESIKSAEQIKTVFNDISILRKEIHTGKGFRLFSEGELEQERTKLAEIQAMIAIINNDIKRGKVAESDLGFLGELRGKRETHQQNIALRGEFKGTLSDEEMRSKLELLDRYKHERRELSKSEQQRAAELANIKKKEVQAEETALRKAMANVKQQIDAKTQLTRIEHEREERAKAGSKQTQEQIDAENRKYQALEETIQRLANAGYRKFGSGVMGKAYRASESYESYSQAKEDQRHLAQLQKIEEQQKKNTKETEKQNKALKDVEMTAERLKNALVAAFGIQQIKRFASEILKVRGEFEMSEVALTNIIGNAEKAQTIWNKTMNLAINSPLSAMQLTRYTKQLAAFRVETGKLYDTTKMLADVSVGLGVDMERLILAYGHTKSSGFLRGMYARQFATAGVNIYGELADYYTKLEGHLVTFRDVYERISKKLVSFSDVEKVFEKITGEGGTFYNMQEKLTNTVQGQINKIKDTWQQAMNTIGKSDQGFIRRITDIVLNIVKNWRIWLRLIESTTAAILVFKATQLTAALFSIQSGAIAASKGMTRLATSIKVLGKNIAANPIGLIITALAAVGVELYSLYKNMRDYNREIDKNNLVLYDARQRLLDYEERIRANNAAIEEYGKKSKKTEEEQESLSKAQSDNANVVSALRKEYPELAEGLEQQANGYVELTKKIEAHNRSLREQVGLNQLMKQQGWFNEGFETDADDYFTRIQKDQAKVIGSIEKMRVALMAKGIDEGELPQVLRDIIGIDWSNPIAGLERYNELLGELYKIREQRISGIQDELLSRGEIKYKGSGEAKIAMENSKEYKEFLYEYADAFDALAGKIDLTTHAYKEFAQNFVIPEQGEEGENLPSMANTFALLYLKELEAQIGELSTEGEEGKVKEQFEKWLDEENQNLAEVVLKHGGQINDWTKEGLLTANETTRQVLINQGKAITKDRQNVLNSELQIEIAFIARQEELAGIRAQLAAEEAKKVTKRSKDRIDELRKQVKDGLEAVEKEWDAFVEQTTESGAGGDEPKATPTYKNLDELLELLKKMNSEYNKLSKSAYGFSKSQEVVMKNYKDAFDEILGKEAGDLVNWETLDITSKAGLESAFKELEKSLNDKNLWGKYGKDVQKLQAKMKKAIADQGVEIDMDVQVRIREDFGKQMEEMFSNYELTLDIEKLNLPSDVLADMFNIETVDLSDLRNKVVQFYEERAAIEADPTELVKQVEGYYKKIDDMERKQQRERIKEYAKYLEYELSERAKIEMEYVRKSAEVATTRGLTNEQKTAIDKRLKKERDEKLAKQEWEDFKSSETYIQMMEDLEHQGVGALEVMRQELERIRANAANLSPRALKEVVNALEKINEITIKRGMPIGNIIRANAGIASAKENAIGAGLEKEQVESRKAARDTLENIKKTILEREKEYRTLSNELGVEKELARLESERTKNNAKMEAMFGDTFAAESDEQIQQRIAEAVGNIETSRKNIAEYQKQAKEADEETLRTISTKVAEEESNLECLLAERGLLEEALRLRIAIAKAEANRGNLTDEERKHLQERVEQLEEELKKLQAQAGAVGSVTKAYGILGDTVQDAFQKMGQWGSQVEQTFESFKGMMQALGTDVDTDTWDALSTSFSVLNTATSTAASAAAKFAAGDYIGASLDIIKGLMDIATQIAELHDKKIDRSIEKSKEKVEDLQKAYERLEKQIEKTFDTVSYMREFNKETQNLYEQIEEANRQIAAAQDYKNEDKRKEAVDAAEDAKQQALDALDEIKQSQIEVFGGIGRDSYRSAAEGFVDAWKSAFLETGDGLQGLQDHFDEFLNDWFVKQATMRIAASNLEPLFRKIDEAVDKHGHGGADVTWQELQEINDLKDLLLEQTNEQLAALASTFGLGGEGSLSGLAAGIQGMTEEQANILEAYWNDVRMNTASIDKNVAMIADILGAGGRNTNPQITYLESIASNTASIPRILELLSGMSVNDGNGKGFRSYMQ